MNKNNTSGFTLIELIISVGIVAIIASVATSYYGSYVMKSKRTDGRTALQNTAITLEKCKNLYGSYNNANCSIANGDTLQSTEGLYDIKVTSAASTFTLTASGVAGKSQASDTECTSMTLDQAGNQSGTGSDITTCW